MDLIFAENLLKYRDYNLNAGHLISNFRRLAELQTKREAINVDRLEDEMERIIAVGGFENKTEIKICLTMGANHGFMINAFKEQGVDAKGKYTDSPFVFTYYDELYRRFRLKPDRAPDDADRELAGRVMIEAALTLPKSLDTLSNDIVGRYLVGRFHPDELETLFNHVVTDGADIIKKRLTDKGCVIPTNPDEILLMASKLHDLMTGADGRPPKPLLDIRPEELALAA